MRRYFISLGLFLTITMMVFMVGTGDAESLVTDEDGNGTQQTIDLEPVELAELALFAANQAQESCESAEFLTLPGGDKTSIINFREDASDPILSCMWGSPEGDRGYQGYRTAWYKFTPTQAGVITLDTLNSTYDTVLAVYKGDCGTLQMLACNDDHQGFSSQVSIVISSTISVQAGEVYYVEVADWQENPPNNGIADLSISALSAPIDSRWEPVIVDGTPSLSRHASVVSGDHIYVIGGQTTLGTTGASTVLHRFNTKTRQWSNPTAMAGPAYFYTAAALVDDRIYVPSGDAGNPNSFDGTHWVYDIAGGYWDQLVDNTWPGDSPIAYSTAVAADGGYYVSGGLSISQPNTFVVHPDVFFYDPDSGWAGRPSLNNARFNHMSALVPGLGVCVTGGFDNSLVNSTECYNGATWQDISAPLNVARHSAGSAVGADGNWYVFGGALDLDGVTTVPFMEMFDPDAGMWQLLDATYELGGFDGLSIRAWPRGHFVGNTLWSIGGHNSEGQVLRQVVKLDGLYLPPDDNDVLLPFVANGVGPAGVADGTFATARALKVNQPMLQDFNVALDLFDAYYFNLDAGSGRKTVKVRLTNIPTGNDYELTVYGDNKNFLAIGSFDGESSKSVGLNLESGRYYLMIQRIAGQPRPGNYYQIKVEVSN